MMCKSHDQYHYDPALREVASILADEAPETRDALLLTATWCGLQAILMSMPDMDPAVRVRCLSRLSAVKSANLTKRFLFKRWFAEYRPPEELDLDEVPW